MNKSVFNIYSQYYDLLYKDKNYCAEAKYISSLLQRYNIPNGNLLEFGSGTGKHARFLVEYGYTVHGIERSKDMVENSEKFDGFTCEVGDIANSNVGIAFDAVLSLFHVISYQTNNSQLNAVFSNAAKHLKKEGLFIFDFWFSPAVYNLQPSVKVKRMSDKNVEITRIAEPVNHVNQNLVDVNYSIFVNNLISGSIDYFTELHTMRHFSLPEIDIYATKNGFEIIQFEEYLTGNTPSQDTWGVCVVLKKLE